MEKNLDRLFVTLPFEKELFDPKKLEVEYVGHPLTTAIALDRSDPLNIPAEKTVVALFPGSREKELGRNFPTQLKAAKKLLTTHPQLLFAVSVAKENFTTKLQGMVDNFQFPKEHLLFVSASQNTPLMKRANLAIAKSGTNNLELALHQVPTVVTYGVGPVDLFIARTVLRIDLPFYCIVNILAGKEVFPELIGPNLTEENLLNKVENFLLSKEALKECKEKCAGVSKMMGNHKPELKIAQSCKQLKVCS